MARIRDDGQGLFRNSNGELECRKCGRKVLKHVKGVKIHMDWKGWWEAGSVPPIWARFSPPKMQHSIETPMKATLPAG